MANTKKKKQTQEESDGAYVLKLVFYFIVGSQWVWFTSNDGDSQIPLPIGLLLGLIFISHEHFQIDRKIEYALLLIACLIGFWAQIGIFVQ